MTDAERFDEAMTDVGGRLNRATLQPSEEERLARVEIRAMGFFKSAAAWLPNLDAIYFDFVDNSAVGAWSTRDDRSYFIGISRGTVTTLSYLFGRMLADPEVLSFIGQPAQEVAGQPLIPTSRNDLEAKAATAVVFPQPRSADREATAAKLLDLALDFLTAHEFSHVANGHIDYNNDRQGVPTISERIHSAAEDAETTAKLIRQTMEMDADATAVWISLNSEYGKIVGTLPTPGPPWTEFYSYPGQVLFQWSWAVSSLFRIFGDARLSTADTLQADYPRPRLRSVMAQQASGRIPMPESLRTLYQPAYDDCHVLYAIKAAYQMVEQAYGRLTGLPEAKEGLDEAWSEVGQSQMARLYNFWNTHLRKDLLSYARQPLAVYDGGEPLRA